MHFARLGILGVTIAVFSPFAAFAQIPTPSISPSSPNSPIPSDITVPAPIGISQPSDSANTQTQSCLNLTRNLSIGSRGSDIVQLQQYLISEGDLASGNDTGYFGKLTEAAVQQWQSSHGVVSSGSAATTGYGAVGPKTRVALSRACSGGGTINPNQSFIDSLLAQVKVLQQRIAALLAARNNPPVPPSTIIVPPIAVGTTQSSCSFGGQTIPSGQSVTAYQSSSVSFGQTCTSQLRTCQNGTLSGSYPYSACSIGGAASCTLDGVNVAHAASQTFYSTKTVPFGSLCSSVSKSRACQNGTLSGDPQYQYGSCTVGNASSCAFNNQSVAHGTSITAYQSSSVSYGSQCVSETRTCSNGTLSGSYQFASCITGTSASCTWNGQTIASGANVTAYQTSSVAFGQSCLSQTRACINGTLWGSYAYASCSANAPTSCTFNGQTLSHGSSVPAYQSSSVAYGNQCVSQQRTCSNGTLSGSYQNSSCSVAAAASCSFNGQTIVNGSSITAYQSSSVAYGSSCASQQRTCTNGTLSGSYYNATCSVAAAQICAWNGRLIPSGQFIIAYQSSSAAPGSQCVSENRTCTNGTLSGSFANPTCVVASTPPTTCSWNGSTISDGSSVTAYQSSSVAYGSQCVPQTRTCSNGTLSGSYQNSSCSVAAAASCTFNGQMVVSGSYVTAYQSSSVAYGSQCLSQSRTCVNGTLSGTYQSASCFVQAAQSCTFNGQTLSNGSSVTAYQSSSVPSGSQCVSQTRTCSNGTLSGTYTNASCIVASATTIPVPPPVTATCSQNGTSVTLSWFAAAGATAYYGRVQGSATSPSMCASNQNWSYSTDLNPAFCANNYLGNVTSTVVNGIVPGASYKTWVEAGNGANIGYAPSSSWTSFTCNASAASSCTFNGQTIASGSSVTAYKAWVTPGSPCVSEQRACINGTLSGSYTNASCAVASGWANFPRTNDLKNLFTVDAPWQTAASHIQVFGFYRAMLTMTDAELSQIIADLKRRHMAIEFGGGPLVPSATCGAGVEGFDRIEVLAAMDRITAAGGTVDFVTMDEPYQFAHYVCGWTAEQVAQQVATFITEVHQRFPNAVVGDVENLTGIESQLPIWLDAFERVTGTPIGYYRADVDWRVPNWPQSVKALEDYSRSKGVPFGILYPGAVFSSSAMSNAVAFSDAGEHVKTYELQTGGKPDQVVFQSWEPKPDQLLPESAPYTFTNFIDAYFTDRSKLGYDPNHPLSPVCYADPTGSIPVRNGQGIGFWFIYNGDRATLCGDRSILQFPLNPGWSLVGVGDFNHDSHNDLLLQNGQQLAEWQMNGAQMLGTGGEISTSLGSGLSVVKTGDFNGDGYSDILFQNGQQLSVWLMNGIQVLPGGGTISQPLGAGWTVAGVGDFNHDGSADVLLQNGQQLAIWMMNGTQILPTSGNIASLLGAGWTVAGVGDFNHDGYADILLQNGQQLAVWYMNGTQILPGGGNISPALNPGWSVVRVGDLNGDGYADILLKNGQQLAIWQMNGTQITNNSATQLLDPGWSPL